jgi:ABC-type branched-subunit amino acid transport system substrate-binding protein
MAGMSFAATRAKVAAAAALGLLAAAGCSGLGGLGGLGKGGGGALSFGPLSGAAVPFVDPATVPGEVLGSGTTKIALLLPLSAEGSVGQLAKDLKNAAALALRDFPSANLQILVKDDSGTAGGARAAATRAVSEGAQLIIGPLFADSVPAAAGAAGGMPVIAFSTDTTKISRGVYLLSFTPQSDVDRVISYAAAHGKTNFAAIIPNTAGGALYLSAFQRAVTNSGGRVVGIERYDTNQVSMQEHAAALAKLIAAGGVDAVFLPDSGDATPFIAQIVAANGVKPGTVTYLGSGQWNDPRIIKESNLSGGWYPGPDDASFAAFASRYRSAFGAQPLRNATLGYDAVSLAAGLATKYGAEGFSPAILNSPTGFIGIDGAFRFSADGSSQRGLAVYELKLGRASVMDAAPRTFASGA